jgi:hypothetical protein
LEVHKHHKRSKIQTLHLTILSFVRKFRPKRFRKIGPGSPSFRWQYNSREAFHLAILFSSLLTKMIPYVMIVSGKRHNSDEGFNWLSML